MANRITIKHRSARAFTLIELLVVITIIGVLISLLLPSLQASRSQAQIVLCANNLRQVGIAMFSYAHENKQYLPGADWRTTTYDPTATSGANTGWVPADWPLVLKEYFGALKATTSAQVNLQAKVMQCPTTFRRNANMSYGINRYAAGKANVLEWKYSRNAPRRLGVDPLIQRHFTRFVISGESTFNNQLSSAPAGFGAAEDGYKTLHPGIIAGKSLGSRLHNDIRNFLLADGHVESQPSNGSLYVINEASAALMPNGGIQWGRNDSDQTYFYAPNVIP